ncbi:regulatory protein (GGDEF domain) [uncultured Mediterranean phage uvMED]|nr:regulatory protein (GGDEF domain) [uncultured Mediterranean phage uvMED]BAQ88927.1 regulatory protein (GGDEF domain) [uncultured Mediterranean phage uvMED]BAQ88976.1 regulatory protein (GGDEF domain) [uncultured Mediterranean phage uvMED]BAQ89090.1 regulatory protein (GGDEF domain) [uncultured Mediterranean phage uvMED]BAQ89154.1 regulatory protein (GGDEF domain) [uncultured Mediterranean phage uvMED]
MNNNDNEFVFDVNNPPNILVNNSTGLIVDVNDSFCALTKFSKDELLGQHRHKLVLSHGDFYQDYSYVNIRTKNKEILQLKVRHNFPDLNVNGEKIACVQSTIVRVRKLRTNPQENIEKYFRFVTNGKFDIVTGIGDCHILDRLPVGISILHESMKFFVYVNYFYANHLGYECHEFLSGKIKPEDLWVNHVNLNKQIIDISDYLDRKTFKHGYYHYRQWLKRDGTIAEGRVLAHKIKLKKDGEGYILAVCDFRNTNKYRLKQTPTVAKKLAEKLNIDTHRVTEALFELSKEGFIK